MHLAENRGHFSIGIFLFRDGAELPLHDHVRMSVYSRCRRLQISCVTSTAVMWQSLCSCVGRPQLQGPHGQAVFAGCCSELSTCRATTGWRLAPHRARNISHTRSAYALRSSAAAALQACTLRKATCTRSKRPPRQPCWTSSFRATLGVRWQCCCTLLLMHVDVASGRDTSAPASIITGCETHPISMLLRS